MTHEIKNNNDVINKLRIHEQDTGSIGLQVGMLTQRINELNEHLKQNPKDHSSATGLMKLVGRRRRFLKYLQHKDEKRYHQLIEQLRLRS